MTDVTTTSKLPKKLEILLDELTKISLGIQPDRLRRVDTSDSEAIVGSANIDEIAEEGLTRPPAKN